MAILQPGRFNAIVVIAMTHYLSQRSRKMIRQTVFDEATWIDCVSAMSMEMSRFRRYLRIFIALVLTTTI
jgi:hypothetical protein